MASSQQQEPEQATERKAPATTEHTLQWHHQHGRQHCTNTNTQRDPHTHTHTHPPPHLRPPLPPPARRPWRPPPCQRPHPCSIDRSAGATRGSGMGGREEAAWAEAGLRLGLRADGRGPADRRPAALQPGALPQASGSARCLLGPTDVLVAVQAQPPQPCLPAPPSPPLKPCIKKQC